MCDARNGLFICDGHNLLGTECECCILVAILFNHNVAQIDDIIRLCERYGLKSGIGSLSVKLTKYFEIYGDCDGRNSWTEILVQ